MWFATLEMDDVANYVGNQTRLFYVICEFHFQIPASKKKPQLEPIPILTIFPFSLLLRIR